MPTHLTRFHALLLLTGLTLGFAAAAAPADYLPGESNLPGWTQEEKPASFTQDTLWDLMDGGAEVYVEYGVEGAASVRYIHPTKGSVLVEIYAMKDAGAAYGVYSLNSRVKGDPVQIGDEALLTNYFVLVRKGTHYMTLTALSSPMETMPACLELARTIADRIPAAAGRPGLLSRLPSLKGPSVRTVYLRGSIGILNLYALDASDPFKPAEGAAAVSEDAQFLVLRHVDEKEASNRFESAWASLSSNPKYKISGDENGDRSLTDEKGNHLVFARDGDCNIIAIGPDATVLGALIKQTLEAKKIK